MRLSKNNRKCELSRKFDNIHVANSKRPDNRNLRHFIIFRYFDSLIAMNSPGAVAFKIGMGKWRGKLTKLCQLFRMEEKEKWVSRQFHIG